MSTAHNLISEYLDDDEFFKDLSDHSRWTSGRDLDILTQEEFNIGQLAFRRLKKFENLYISRSISRLAYKPSELYDDNKVIIAIEYNRKKRNVTARIVGSVSSSKIVRFLHSITLYHLQGTGIHDSYRVLETVSKLRPPIIHEELLRNYWRTDVTVDPFEHRFWPRKVGNFTFHLSNLKGRNIAMSYLATGLDLNMSDKSVRKVERVNISIEYYPTKKSYRAFLMHVGMLSPSVYVRNDGPLATGPSVGSDKFYYMTKEMNKDDLIKVIEKLSSPLNIKDFKTRDWKSFQ